MSEMVNFSRNLGPPGLVLPVTKMVTSGGDDYASFMQSAGAADTLQKSVEAEAPLADLQWYTDWQRERASRFIPEDVELSLSQIREHFQLPRLSDLEGQAYLNAQAGDVQASGGEYLKASEYLAVRSAILAYQALRDGNPNAQPDPIPPETNVGRLNTAFNNVVQAYQNNPSAVSTPFRNLLQLEQTFESLSGRNLDLSQTNNNLGSVQAHDNVLFALQNYGGMNASFYLSEANRLTAIADVSASFQAQYDGFQTLVLEAAFRSGTYGVRPDGQGGYRGTWGLDQEGVIKDYRTDEIQDTASSNARFASERTRDVGTDGSQDVPETSDSEQVTPDSVMGVGFLGFGRATTPMAQRTADRALYANTQQQAAGRDQSVVQEPTSNDLQGTATRSTSILVNDPQRSARSPFKKVKAELVKLIGGADNERKFLTDQRVQALLEAFDRVQTRIDGGEFEGQDLEDIEVLNLLGRDEELRSALGLRDDDRRFGFGEIRNLLGGLDAERLESILNIGLEEGSFVRAPADIDAVSASEDAVAEAATRSGLDSETIAFLDALDNRDESEFEDFIDQLTRQTRREREITSGSTGPLANVSEFLASNATGVGQDAIVESAQLALEGLVPVGAIDALENFRPPAVPLDTSRLEFDIVTADALAQRLRSEVQQRDDLSRPSIVRDVVERLIRSEDLLRGLDDPEDVVEVERVVGLIVSQQVLAAAERLTATALQDAEEQRIRLQEEIARGLEVVDPLGLVSDLVDDDSVSLVQVRRTDVTQELERNQIELIDDQNKLVADIRDEGIERVVEDFDVFSAQWESVDVYLREFIMEPGKALVVAHSIFNQPPQDASGDAHGQLSYEA